MTAHRKNKTPGFRLPIRTSAGLSGECAENETGSLRQITSPAGKHGKSRPIIMTLARQLPAEHTHRPAAD